MTWTGKNEVLDEVISRAELERMLDEAGATYTCLLYTSGLGPCFGLGAAQRPLGPKAGQFQAPVEPSLLSLIHI